MNKTVTNIIENVKGLRFLLKKTYFFNCTAHPGKPNMKTQSFCGVLRIYRWQGPRVAYEQIIADILAAIGENYHLEFKQFHRVL